MAGNLATILHKTLTVENFGSRKLCQIAAQKHFGREYTDGLSALHS